MPQVTLPNQVSLHALKFWLSANQFFGHDLNDTWTVDTQKQIVHLRPFALAQLAAWATEVRAAGGSVAYVGNMIPGIRYASRMGLFNYMDSGAPHVVEEHEEAGRFIPLRLIQDQHDKEHFLTDLSPLLHNHPEAQQAIRYCLSELLNNVLEHSQSDNGAFACAQYFAESKKVSIGVADCGQGVRRHIRRNHAVSDDISALVMALRPGTTGALKGESGLGGENAGAGLFFTKTIARTGGNEFAIVSGDAFYKLNRVNDPHGIPIDPRKDNHVAASGLPVWNGTIVGLEVSTSSTVPFEEVLGEIREVFGAAARKVRRDYGSRVRFG